MTDAQNKTGDQELRRFQNLLEEIFQFKTSDLDFGIYRILNYKRDRIKKFIEEDLKEKVESAFAEYKNKRVTDIVQEYEEVKKKLINTLGQNALTPTGDLKQEYIDTPIGKEFLSIKAQKEEAEMVDVVKNQVFNDLYEFFSRYYENGDFISQYRYSIKSHKYAIPYNGEEVKLYWANSDQYYVKTGLLFRDYTFKVNDYKVIFRVVEAKEELGSNKATKERFFVLDDERPVEVEDKTVIIRFQYRELTDGEVKKYKVEGGDNISKQEKVNRELCQKILKKITDDELQTELSNEYKNENSLLLYHLNRFTAKNTKDYFIHKNLKEFLTEQLDYFIKSEVLDIETIKNVKLLDKYVIRARVVREIGEAIIDFLSQIEDFQKRLWEKKKFVLKTEYVITTDRVPEEFHEEILKNEEQKKEWGELGFAVPKSKEELKNKKLPVDTRYFPQEFKERLLEKLTEDNDLDEILDGLLIKSENWQALNLLLNKYKGKVQTIYIDPPYNTGSDGFLYRDRYQHSSWLTMMENRLSLARELMRDDGVIFVSIDDNEMSNLTHLLQEKFSFLSNIVWRKLHTVKNDARNFSVNTEYILCYAKNLKDKEVIKTIGTDKSKSYKYIDEKGPFKLDPLHAKSGTETYEYTFKNGIKWKPPVGTHIRYSIDNLRKFEEEGKIVYPGSLLETIDGKQTVYKGKYPMVKRYLSEVYEGIKVESYWDGMEVGFNKDTTSEFQNLFCEFGRMVKSILNPKPTSLVKRCIEISTEENSIILDFFAGSGTTAHAVIKLNKEDGGKRKFILVEMGDYFDTVIIPRIKKVAYSLNWKDGKPEDEDGTGVFFQYQILEQYEDTLDNIEFKENQEAQEFFKDNYLLKYFLDFETRESPYLLNIEMLEKPFDYKLKVNLKEVGEPQEMVIDLPETFNYLLGLKVKKVKVRNNGRKYLFILGEREGKDVAVVWRDCDDSWKEEDFKKDKEFIIEELKVWKPQIVYVSGQSVLTPEGWEVRYIEPVFEELMEA